MKCNRKKEIEMCKWPGNRRKGYVKPNLRFSSTINSVPRAALSIASA